MARTLSTMAALGTPVPSFALTDVVTGRSVAPAEHAERPLLVMFVCNHCPFVIHVREALVRLADGWTDRGLGVIAISSNDAATHPQDGPGPMAELARREGWRFPYAFDETQRVARAFDAACTPDFFLYDAAHRLAYRGQLDDSRPGSNVPVTGADLAAAVDAVLAGLPPSADQKASLGCNIKWRPGNEPNYVR